MTCNNCDHKKVCWQCREVDSGNPMMQNYRVCEEFADKSKTLHLPCQEGEVVYKIVHHCNFDAPDAACSKSGACKKCDRGEWIIEEQKMALWKIVDQLDEFGRSIFTSKKQAESILQNRDYLWNVLGKWDE